MFCTHCGSQVPSAARFCTSCGQQVVAAAAAAGVPGAAPIQTPTTQFLPAQPTQAPWQPPQAQHGQVPDWAPVATGAPSPASPYPASPPAPVPMTVQNDGPAPPVGVRIEVQRTQSMVGPAPTPAHTFLPSATPQNCPWCGGTFPSGATSCPQCGATLKSRKNGPPSDSGWLELPPRKDMAKLQFGNSSCQIEGLYVPVADMNLAAEDSVYFTHHVLLWMDTKVSISTMPLAGGWKRMFAGMPLIMTQAQGPGHIAFSRDAPGELIALPLHPGQEVDVREHMFLAATSHVQYDWFQTNIWYSVQNDKEYETFYPLGMFMDRFSSPSKPGLLLLHAAGSVLVRQLAAGETILVKPTALIFKDPTVQMELHIEYPNSGMFSMSSLWGGGYSWTNRTIWLRLYGPGRVAIQSVFERVEREGGNIVDTSFATVQYW